MLPYIEAIAGSCVGVGAFLLSMLSVGTLLEFSAMDPAVTSRGKNNEGLQDCSRGNEGAAGPG